MASKKIEFASSNTKAFAEWLKRFATIDNTLLLEINETSQEFVAKSYNEERSVVKRSQIKFEDAGFTYKTAKDPKTVKVGIYNISRIIKIMDQFNSAEFAMVFNCEELTAESTFAGTTITFSNKSLKMSIDCTSISIFKHISDDTFTNVIATATPIVEFPLHKENIIKINSLCGLDNDYKYMSFKTQNNSIYASGKSFDFLLEENKVAQPYTLDVFKDQFQNVDIENYEIVLGDDRMKFKSSDSNTVTVISMVEKSE